MIRKNLSKALSDIDQKYILEAANNATTHKPFPMVKWAAMAACLCLVICGALMLHNYISTPPVPGGDPLVIDPISRGPNEDLTGSETTSPHNILSSTIGNAEQINVYEITSINLNIEDILTNLDAANWKKTECMMSDEYSFYLKGTPTETRIQLKAAVCEDLAKAFMEDSGLISLLGKHGVLDYEYETSDNDGLVVTYCYFMCDGGRTGAYIRLIFEDYKHVGEVQAHIYSSEKIDTLPLLSLDNALKNACKLREGKLEKVKAEDYRIKNAKLVYVNGLPYYRFDGYGINSRALIDGFALAIDFYSSSVSEQLISQHQAFKFE